MSPEHNVDDSPLEIRSRGIRLPRYKMLPEQVTRNRVKRHNIDQPNANSKRSRISESNRFIGVSKRNRRRPAFIHQVVSKPLQRYKLLPPQVSREKFKKRMMKLRIQMLNNINFHQIKKLLVLKKESQSHKGRHKFIFKNWQSL